MPSVLIFSKKRTLLLCKAAALTLAVRLALLATQRMLGIEWNFHPDATYYVARIANLSAFGVSSLYIEGDFENILFVVLGYILSLMVFRQIDDATLLIFLNLALATLTTVKLVGICSKPTQQRLPIPVLFYAISPYLAHISIHPLKDVLAVYLTTCLLASLLKNRLIGAVIFGALLIFTRYYLGIITMFALSLWWVGSLYKLRERTFLIGTIVAVVVIYIAVYDQLATRLAVEFEGRNFYPNGLALVPDSVTVRFLFGWFFNFLVPFPFVPSSTAEVGYFFHWLLLTYLIAAFGYKRLKRGIPSDRIGLLLAALFLLSFVLTTTPGTGPLVRYRLASELLLLIAIFTDHFKLATTRSRRRASGKNSLLKSPS